MDYEEVQEIYRVLCIHEEFININKTTIFLMATKVHENEHQSISYNVLLMDTLVQHKRQIQVLKAKFPAQRNMVYNLSKGLDRLPPILEFSLIQPQNILKKNKFCIK